MNKKTGKPTNRMFRKKAVKRVYRVSGATPFGHRLRKAREALGKSQAQIGLRVGAQQTRIAMFENGRALPRLPIFVKLCRALKTTPNDILGF